MPRIEGMDSFKGRSFHTFHWPHEPVELAGKKVAVIGTGATAHPGDRRDRRQGRRAHRVPAPAELVRAAEQQPDLDAEMADIRARYDEIFATCARTPGGFVHEPDRRGFYEVTPEERVAFWEKLYDEPGFGIWLGNFRDIFTDEAANAEFSDYIADRIRRRVKDPVVAEKLIPKDHGFGVQRVPLETDYFEVYNRDNVHLVDISETPIERITETGLRTSARDYEFDIIIYATGFDAITGAFDRIDIRGVGGEKLSDKWKRRPVDLPRHAGARLPEHADADRAAERLGLDEFSARHREPASTGAPALLEHMWDRGYTRADADGRGARRAGPPTSPRCTRSC